MMTNIKYLLICIFFLSLNSSCLKFDDGPQISKRKPNCSEFKGIKIRPMNTIPFGEDIIIKTDSFPDLKYDCIGPNGFNQYNLKEIGITNQATPYHQGWYYVTTKYSNCPSIYDSIFVDVTLKQGNPSCNPSNNTSAYINNSAPIPNKVFTTVSIDTSNGFVIKAAGTNGQLTLTFSEFWKRNKLEAGIYYTSSDYQLLDKEDIDKVFIKDMNFMSPWYAAEFQKPIYISYVSGKLTITLCDLLIKDPDFNGNPIYNSRLSAKITLP
jgi:hypothetical protein